MSRFSPIQELRDFCEEIVDEVGATDDWDLNSNYQSIDVEGAEWLAKLVESPSRRLPVIVVSEEPQTGAVVTDPGKLTRFLSGAAHVFLLTTAASWELTRRWGSDWSVFQGAVRCYNPGFDRNGDKFKHRLWFSDHIQRLDANSRQGFVNAVTSHVFTQITALFESVPLITPSGVKREIEEPVATHVEPNESLLDGAEEQLRQSDVLLNLEDQIRAELGLQDQEVAELKISSTELSSRIRSLEDSNLKLEHDLQEERAARAETERTLSESRAELDMFEKENVLLEQQQALAFGDVSKEPSEALRPLWEHFSSLFNAMQITAIKFRRMEQDADMIDELERELSEVRQDNINKTATIESLRRRSSEGGDLHVAADKFRGKMGDLLPRAISSELKLVDLLDFVSLAFPQRVHILDTAYASAEDSETFLHIGKAFDLLWRLTTEYWDELRERGDIEARKVFGNSYASNEGDNLSKAGIKKRTFQYGEQSVLMLKHLKLGTAFNSSDTLRIHFEWFASEERIVVGHCGKHLDF